MNFNPMNSTNSVPDVGPGSSSNGMNNIPPNGAAPEVVAGPGPGGGLGSTAMYGQDGTLINGGVSNGGVHAGGEQPLFERVMINPNGGIHHGVGAPTSAYPTSMANNMNIMMMANLTGPLKPAAMTAAPGVNVGSTASAAPLALSSTSWQMLQNHLQQQQQQQHQQQQQLAYNNAPMVQQQFLTTTMDAQQGNVTMGGLMPQGADANNYHNMMKMNPLAQAQDVLKYANTAGAAAAAVAAGSTNANAAGSSPLLETQSSAVESIPSSSLGTSSNTTSAVAAGAVSHFMQSNAAAAAATATTTANMFHGKGSFPLNLTLMLESAESMNHGHIVSWLPSGHSFVIHDPDQFLSVVLPKFFKSSKNTKIRSFYRKLNRWGFSILRNHHLTKEGVGTMKGVWHHPDFYRTRAVECLKIAFETGDTDCLLSVSHAKAGGSGEGEADGSTTNTDVGYGLGEEQVSRRSSKKRRGSSPCPSLRSSSITESSYYGAPRASRGSSIRRESEFSVGDDSPNLESTAQEEFKFQQALAGNPPAFNGGVASAYGSSLGGSFTSAAGSSQQLETMVEDGTASPLVAKRGRSSVHISRGLSSSATFQRYQPVTQSGATAASIIGSRQGGRQGVSASWTAGSTVSQQDFNFPNPIPDTTTTISRPPIQDCDEPLDYNSNVYDIGELASMSGQIPMLSSPPVVEEGGQQIQGQQGNEDPDALTPEDMELANFFDKFAETFQK